MSTHAVSSVECWVAKGDIKNQYIHKHTPLLIQNYTLSSVPNILKINS